MLLNQVIELRYVCMKHLICQPCPQPLQGRINGGLVYFQVFETVFAIFQPCIHIDHSHTSCIKYWGESVVMMYFLSSI